MRRINRKLKGVNSRFKDKFKKGRNSFGEDKWKLDAVNSRKINRKLKESIQRINWKLKGVDWRKIN